MNKLVFGLVAAMGLSGCIVTSGSETYEQCDFTSDCNNLGDDCRSITADWGERITTDGICSFSCFDTSDCPISLNGNFGLCIDFGGTGVSSCYETCSFDTDCDPGFRCGDFGFAESVCLPF